MRKPRKPRQRKRQNWWMKVGQLFAGYEILESITIRGP